MNKNLAIASGIIVIAAIGGFVLFRNTPSTAPISKPTSIVSQTENITEDGKYISYNDTVFTAATGKTRVLFFYANWCPTCKPINIEFEQNPNEIPEGMMVFRVNYNDTETDQAEKDLAKQYGVTYQHTFVQVDPKGNEVTKWNGGGLEELKANIK